MNGWARMPTWRTAGVWRTLLAWRGVAVWRSVVACALHLPLAVAYSIVVLVLFVASIALMPLFLLGAPLLALTLRLMRSLATAERTRCQVLMATAVEAPTRSPKGLWRGLREDLRAARTWREMAYFRVALPVLGLVGYALSFSLPGLAVAGVVAPFLTAPRQPVLPVLPYVGWWWLLLGLVLLAFAGQVVRLCGHGWALVVRGLLARGVEDNLVERIETLTESRDALAAAAEAERARIERDLHDGAQQRLVALAINLGLARTKLDSDQDAVGHYVEQAHEEAKAALDLLPADTDHRRVLAVLRYLRS
jgi:signal transduction histidine kinase